MNTTQIVTLYILFVVYLKTLSIAQTIKNKCNLEACSQLNILSFYNGLHLVLNFI
jgi:hypothetical protein